MFDNNVNYIRKVGESREFHRVDRLDDRCPREANLQTPEGFDILLGQFLSVHAISVPPVGGHSSPARISSRSNIGGST